jgi:hypothetical protein
MVVSYGDALDSLAGSLPLGTPTEEVLSYADGTDGPLIASEAASYATGTRTAAAQGEVPVGGCSFFDPEIYVIYDRSRPATPYAYSTDVGARCGGTYAAYCYSELWRQRDSKVVAQHTDYGNGTSCTSAATHGWYVLRNKHYAKGSVTLTARSGAHWGQGSGPRGWRCTGQGTTRLNCIDVTGTLS